MVQLHHGRAATAAITIAIIATADTTATILPTPEWLHGGQVGLDRHYSEPVFGQRVGTMRHLLIHRRNYEEHVHIRERHHSVCQLA